MTADNCPEHPTTIVYANTCSPFPADAEPAGPLSPEEQAALRACEEVIKTWFSASLKAGEALKQIRDQHLYRATHRTFAEYVEGRWAFKERRAQQLMKAYDLYSQFESAGVTSLPVNENQLRSLTSIPMEEAREVWEDLVDTVAAEKISGMAVRKAVQERYGAPTRGDADLVPGPDDADPVPDPADGDPVPDADETPHNDVPLEDALASWSRGAIRALKEIPEEHRERFIGVVNDFTKSPTGEVIAEVVAEVAAGYAAAVLEDGTSAPSMLVGEATSLVAATEEGDEEPFVDEPFIDIPILDDVEPTAYDPATKRNVAFLGAAQKKPLLVCIPRLLLPRRLRRELPEGVVSVIVEIDELERHGGPVRRGILDVELIREAAREARMIARLTYTNAHVDWARYTINPLTGCRHRCRVIFCYAAGIAQRLFPQGFIPTLYPARLNAFEQTRLPDVSHLPDDAEAWRERSVFNTSMGDLFGPWVPDWYIEQVLSEVGANPGWFSFFLTKNPGRLAGFTFPENCAVGITITGEEGGAHRHADFEKQGQIYAKSAQALARVKGAKFTWLSVEPFRAEIFDLSPFVDAGVQMVAVGGQSRTVFCKAEQPDIRWVESVRHQVRRAGLSLFEKENLTVHAKEIPFPAGRPLDAPARRGPGRATAVAVARAA